MIIKIILKSFSIAFMALGTVYAQKSLVATGKDASSAAGSVSYSVGQISNSSKGANNEVSEGVQQAYEIITLATSETKERNITLYPNPVKDVLFVDFNQESYSNSSYQLFDAQGKMIKQGKFTTKKNELDLSALPQSIYIIRIVQESKELKTFKIIKK